MPTQYEDMPVSVCECWLMLMEPLGGQGTIRCGPQCLWLACCLLCICDCDEACGCLPGLHVFHKLVSPLLDMLRAYDLQLHICTHAIMCLCLCLNLLIDFSIPVELLMLMFMW